MSPKSLSGVFVALPTPFRDEKLCLSSLRKHLAFLVDAGVHGFVCCATTGESPTLTNDEKKILIEECLKISQKNSLRTLVGTGSNSTQKTIEDTLMAQSLGADGAMIVSPYYNKPSQKGLLAHILAVANSTEIPLILYNIPGRVVVRLEIETIQKAFEHPRVMGIKEATGDFHLWQEMARQIDWSEKSFLTGDDDNYAVLGLMGATGMISGPASVIPHQCVALHNLVMSKKFEEAFRLQLQINPFIDLMFKETNPGPVKKTLAQLIPGYPSAMRLPMVEPSSEFDSYIEKAFSCLPRLS